MTFKDCFVQFFKDEEGASGIEYALIAAMVAVAIVAFVPGIKASVEAIFGGIETELGNAAPASSE